MHRSRRLAPILLTLTLLITGCAGSAPAALGRVSAAPPIGQPPLSPLTTPTPVPTITPLPELSATPTLPIPTETPTPTPAPTIPPEILAGTVQPSTVIGKALVINQDTQLMHVYENGAEIRVIPVSTGEPPLYTPAFSGNVRYYIGSFVSFGSWADNAWYVFMGSAEILIHSLPYTVAADGTKIYEGAEHLGVRPASHGCIRLHPDDAEWLTAWDPGGVPIVITPLDLNREW